MNKKVNPLALGSDIARSHKQLWLRRVAKLIVSLFRLNKCGNLSTEILQAANPVLSIPTPGGRLLCRGGHGRLVWRADSFFSEEPYTIAWLDQLTRDDVYWDVGANIGLYAIYAAKFKICNVIAFEPESQNYSLLIDNMLINGVQDKLLGVPIALADKSGFGKLQMHYFTKGGAHNLFMSSDNDKIPFSIQMVCGESTKNSYKQLIYSSTLDNLVYEYGFQCPTYVKIDVDGTESNIIEGGKRVFESGIVKSVLVEINHNEDMRILDYFAGIGYKIEIQSPVVGTKQKRSSVTDVILYRN